MTFIAANTSTSSSRFDAIFAAVIASCADFCAGVRQGRDLADRYYDLDRRSGPDLARLGLARSEIAQAALRGTRH
jgi:hypothetical protein